MITSIEQFEKYWSKETGYTQAVLDALTDQSLSQSIVDGHRTLGRIAWHTVTTLPEMMKHAGLDFGDFNHEAPVPKTAREISDAYSSLSALLLKSVKSKWTDETMQQVDDMYGEKWSRGFTLMVLMQHEIHHRGQMTVLMRQADLVVPSIYGPAKEGWAAYGAPPPQI